MVKALNLVNTNRLEGYLSAHAVTNIFYILRRKLGVSRTLELLQLILQKLKVATVNEVVISSALQSSMADFEDAVTSEAAKATQIEIIVTRNTKDYTSSPIQAIEPNTLLSLFE